MEVKTNNDVAVQASAISTLKGRITEVAVEPTFDIEAAANEKVIAEWAWALW